MHNRYNTVVLNRDILRAYFAKLNLEPQVADIYLALHSNGPQTISELSRRSGVERTRIYRTIETMATLNLIEVETQYKRRIIHPAPVNNLNIVLSKKEEELRSLQKELGHIQQLLQDQAGQAHTTSVRFFKGSEGLKQLFWNQLQATTPNLSILYENAQGRTKGAFFERWANECNKRKLVFRGIIGDYFIETQKEWYAARDNERLKDWQARYVPASLFTIRHSTIIYNDIVAYFSWHEGSAFGIELHNKNIADAQRQFFAMLWEKSTPVGKDISQQLKG